MRLGRARRLRKGPEFERVFKEGAAAGGPFFVLRTVPNDLGYARWGFAVGKKAFRKSTDRNRLRRQLRSAVQDLEPTGSLDVVVVARPSAAGKRYGDLRTALAKQLSRAGFEVGRR